MDASSAAPPPGPSKQASQQPGERRGQRQPTPLGQALIDKWLAAREPLRPFLHERDVPYTTWFRVVYGDASPQARTVVRLAEAVGLDRDEALRLAGLKPALGAVEPPAPRDQSWTHTALGDALETCRVTSGESVHVFCANRGLDVSTWYRLVRHGHVPRESTVIKYATAAGLDVDRALTLAGYQPRQLQQPQPQPPSQPPPSQPPSSQPP